MSKLIKTAIIATIISSVAISPAWADRYGHHHDGFGWGLGLLVGTAAYLAATTVNTVATVVTAPRAYYSPPVAPVYVYPAATMPPAVAAYSAPVSSAQNSWYYCAQSASYYPYVTSCPSGWTRVSPTPPG